MNTRNSPTVTHIDTRRARTPRLSEAELDACIDAQISANREHHAQAQAAGRCSVDAADYSSDCNFNCEQGRACDCVPDLPVDEAAAVAAAQRRARRWVGAMVAFWRVAIFVVVAVFGQPVLPR